MQRMSFDWKNCLTMNRNAHPFDRQNCMGSQDCRLRQGLRAGGRCDRGDSDIRRCCGRYARRENPSGLGGQRRKMKKLSRRPRAQAKKKENAMAAYP